MNHTRWDAKKIQMLIKVFELKKEKVKQQIFQINNSITEKKLTINRFQEYAVAYNQKCNSMAICNINIIKNSQAFYQNIDRVIVAEKNGLSRLEKIHHDLLISYQESVKKSDGLSKLYSEVIREKSTLEGKIEDSELSDLSINRSGRKNSWNP